VSNMRGGDGMSCRAAGLASVLMDGYLGHLITTEPTSRRRPPRTARGRARRSQVVV
jgi:hypothetical protein